jgi:hypothetical protein
MAALSFNELLAQVRPIVFDNVKQTVSVKCANEIAEDITYLIKHGFTVEMYKKPEKRDGV